MEGSEGVPGTQCNDSPSNVAIFSISAEALVEKDTYDSAGSFSSLKTDAGKTVVFAQAQADVKREAVSNAGEINPVKEIIGGAMEKSERDKNSLQCSTCERVFKNSGALATHRKSHSQNIRTGEKKPKASDAFHSSLKKCRSVQRAPYKRAVKPVARVSDESNSSGNGGSDTTGDNKQARMLRHSDEENIMFQCVSCDEVFSGEKTFRAHMKTHTYVKSEGRGAIGRECSSCLKSSGREDCHRGCQCAQTGKKKLYTCSLCGERFKIESRLLRHLEKEHGNALTASGRVPLKTHPYSQSDGKLFRCEECDKTFKFKPYFLKHIKRHMVSIKSRFKCSICKQPFKDKAFLEKHIRMYHAGINADGFETEDIKPVIGESFGGDGNSCQVSKDFSHFTKEKSNVCIICNKVLARARDMDRHMKTHIGEKHRCDICDKMFARTDNLLHHKRMFHEDVFSVLTDDGLKARFQCTSCDKEFQTRLTFERHKKMHKAMDKGKFKCVVCGKHFHDESSLREHSLLHPKSHRCEFCGRCFKYSTTYERHITTHQGKDRRLYTCAICSRSYDTQPILNRHMFSHNKNKSFKCPTCGKAFTTKAFLNIHESKIHGGARVFPCAVCGHVFKQRRSAKRHELMHSGKRLHRCSLCSKKFEMEFQLNRHMTVHAKEKTQHRGKANWDLSHTNTNNNLVKEAWQSNDSDSFMQEVVGKVCSICHKVFKTDKGLEGHMSTHNRERYHCDFCFKSFARFYVLRSHLRVIHKQVVVNTKKTVDGQIVRHEETDKVLFRCPVCGLVFIHRNELEAHTKIHTGEKPYACSLCSEKFNGRDHLQRHLDSDHSEEDLKTLVCPTCGNRFKRKNDFARHLQIHSKDIAYSCPKCGKLFVRKDSLKAHLKRVHFSESI